MLSIDNLQTKKRLHIHLLRHIGKQKPHLSKAVFCTRRSFRVDHKFSYSQTPYMVRSLQILHKSIKAMTLGMAGIFTTTFEH
ncbi:hypothetical protein BST96_06565 [Oceanicoccus sagamiensis]|uniref:Uncharacterized protein n=1 Tax=Oceanicoccus sagamiensis TaxID=716816 RepID=A0A1X9NIJ3_9GAMM|nr:hypothetical protein BST96_06565 [Oceanicoccus sagamiensis]